MKTKPKHPTKKNLLLNYDRIVEIRNEVCEKSHVNILDFFIKERYGCPQEVRHYFYYLAIKDGFRQIDVVRYMNDNNFKVAAPSVIYGVTKYEKFFSSKVDEESKVK
tara:strand:+ start:1692 stop:2012 length:321 start_codon:yes stop_codon:yes gene_type:complete